MRWLKSPRRRRQLLWTLPILIVVPLVYLGVHYSSPGNPENASGGKADIYREPKHVPFEQKDQQAVHKVLADFVDHAVARHDVGTAWTIAGPALREGTTRRDWQKGDIPVVPYPASKHGQGTWSYVEFSYPNRVGVEVVLFPKPRSGYSMATADAELMRNRDGRWLVDYWMIKKFHGPAATAPADATSALSEGPPKVHKLPGKGPQAKAAKPKPPPKKAAPETPIGPKPVSRMWLLLPLAILSLIVLVPLGLGAGMWIRNRRAAAELKRS